MAANAAEFLISIEQRIKGDDAASALERAEQAATGAVAAYKKLETATEKAVSAHEKVSNQIAATRAAMDEAAKQNNLAAYTKAHDALKKLEQQEKQLAAAANAAKAAQTAQAKAASNAATVLENERAAAEKGGLTSKVVASEIYDLESAFGDLGGPIGGAGKKILEVGEAFKKFGKQGGPLGLVAAGAILASAAVVALTAVIVVGIAAALKYGVAMANAARNTRLTMEAMLGSKKAAAEVAGTFRQIQRTVGGSNERLTEITKQLKEAGVEGDAMRTALRAIATQEAALGSQDKTGDLIEKLKTGQTTAEKLAKTIEKDFGEAARAKAIGLDQSMDRLKGNVGALFSGLNIEPLLVTFSRLVDMFDETSESGQFMKRMFETLFQPLLNAVNTAIPYAILFVLKFVDTLLDIVIWAMPAIKWVARLFKLIGVTPENALETTLAAARVAAIAFAVGVGVALAIVVVFGAVCAMTALIIYTAFMSILKLPALIANAIIWVIKAVKGINLTQIGLDLMNGLAQGIKDGLKAVLTAAKGVADALPASIKKLLGIASPSTVFAELGMWSARGFAVGIEDETPSVEKAITGMVGGEGKGRGGGGNTYNYGPFTIIVNGAGDDGDAIATKVRKELDHYFTDMSLELGGSPA